MTNLSSRLKQLPFAAAFLVTAGLTVWGTAYWFSYQNKLAYLTSRDFRLLATVGSQTEDQLSDIATKEGAGKYKSVRWKDLEGPSLVFTDKAGQDVDRRLEEAIGGLFQSKIDQGAFDTLVFATQGGQVAFATGGRERELQGMDLAALLPEPAIAPKAGETPPSFAERFSRKVTVQDAVVAGTAYRMFIQPCCRLVKETAGTASGRRTAGGGIVVGLVQSEALRSEAMAVSPTLVIIAALLVLLALLAWPFLNIALQGPRQRVTQWDALQLGFSGMLGLAIITIVAITTVQGSRLEHDIDKQLEGLATDLDTRLSTEVTAQFTRLTKLEEKLIKGETPPQTTINVANECQPTEVSARQDGGSSERGDYTAVFLVRKDGRQFSKASPKGCLPLLDVKDRAYFRYFTDKSTGGSELRGTECGGEPCILESLVSWSTGDRSAVLAKPTGNSGLPVAGLGFPLQPLLKTVVPPGFEFAIIDRTGHVMFHSDVERNNHENLFVETDQDRELRSLVGSGIDGDLHTDYWGRPYQAYVKHAEVFGWSVVTLFDRRSIRGLMVEWTIVSLFLLVAYALLWLAAMYLVVAKRSLWIWPERIRPWMWPDRFRTRRYQLLALGYLALLAVFAFVVSSPESFAWLGLVDQSHDASAIVGLAGFVIPLLASAVTFLVLSKQPPAKTATARHEPRLEYCVAVALLLAIIGILPGMAFVARSYDSHMEAYLKYRQMGLVQGLSDKIPPGLLPMCDGAPAGHTVPGLYSAFLYQTSVCRRATATECGGPQATEVSGSSASTPPGRVVEAHDESGGRDPLSILESSLPYYSEESVKLRELLHHRADDCSWTSERRDGSLFLEVADGPHGAWMVQTAIPPLTLGSFASADGGALMAMLPAEGMALLLTLIFLAYGVARFMRDYVFLGQVASPPWAVGRLAIPEGDTVILLCDPVTMAPRIDGAELELRPPAPNGATDQEHQAARPGRVFLVPDLKAKEAGSWLERSLKTPGTDTVIALSSEPLDELAKGLRGSSPEDADAIERLAATGRVTVLDWRAESGPSDGPLTVSTVLPAPVWWRRAWSVMTDRQSPAQPGHPEGRPRTAGRSPAEALLHAEERAYPALRKICDEVRRLESFRAGRLGAAEALEEIDDRAEALYEDLWDQCPDNEKLALRHIAEFGLANSGNRRAVSRLIARRLVTKDPDLRLMNHSFERFVLSRDHSASADIARIEGEIPASTWDRLRTPLVLVSVVVAVFLFTTQRDMFNTTVGALVGISAAAPSMLKLVSLMAGKDPAPGRGTNV